jgi:hypothetical protein
MLTTLPHPVGRKEGASGREPSATEDAGGTLLGRGRGRRRRFRAVALLLSLSRRAGRLTDLGLAMVLAGGVEAPRDDGEQSDAGKDG